MKLQREVNRTVGEVTYYKWRVPVPAEMIERLGWKKGEELEAVVRGDSLIFRRSKNP